MSCASIAANVVTAVAGVARRRRRDSNERSELEALQAPRHSRARSRTFFIMALAETWVACAGEVWEMCGDKNFKMV